MQQEIANKEKQLKEMQELLEIIRKDSEQKDQLIKTLTKVKERYHGQ